ncbi:hypothetical protein NADFUDRAFT_50782 [Nadsonia fulvescens var. elongata DSM 6958]|uniref:Uncharacterized protein n=1 Tax=Nadsonia fulvescens var. elongata DSM 6958 TaxID=857566 RepID=A0A1E3PJM1_9ASCO|nr:hypothetical protein NADFUDRAFT_50782 [Nadsonia fulvescens var. elongata DSM 6958]
MPAPDNIDVLVARYLRDRGFNKSLSAFYEAVGELDIPASGPDLPQILEERRQYLDSIPVRNSAELEASSDGNKEGLITGEGVVELCPSVLDYSRPALIVSLIVADLTLSPDKDLETKVICTMADKTLRIMPLFRTSKDGTDDDCVLSGLHGTGAVKCVKPIGQRYLLTAGMDGGLRLTDLWSLEKVTPNSIDNRLIKAHTKFVITVDVLQVNEDIFYIASAGYDNRIQIYEISLSGLESQSSDNVFRSIGSLDLSTTPTCLRFHPASGHLLVTKKDSTFVYFIQFNSTLLGLLTQLARFDLCEAQFASHSFTILDFILVQQQSSSMCYLVAVTSHTPYQRVIIAKLSAEGLMVTIEQNVSSYAPQDKFSSAQITAWPNDGGLGSQKNPIVFVTGDDGIARGLSIPEGKLICKLDDGIHKTRIKTVNARSNQMGDFVVVTGGVDKTICVWSQMKRK